MKFLSLFLMVGLWLGSVDAQAFYSRLDVSNLDCRHWSETCSTIISWSVSRGTGIVTVEVPTSNDYSERREKLFNCGSSGRAVADWIRKNGDRYVFRLYEGVRCPKSTYPNYFELGREVDRREVSYNGGFGFDPGFGFGYSSLESSRLRPLGNGLWTTQISWSSQSDRGTGVVTVEVGNERREKLFACGKDGRQDADWIQSGQTYTFRLYENVRCPNGTYVNKNQLGRESKRIQVRGR